MNLTLDKLFQIPKDVVGNCENKTFVGIDFGTSTTVVSIASYSEFSENPIHCKTLDLKQVMKDGSINESFLIPSIMCWVQGQRLLVGQGAYQQKWKPEYEQGVNLWHSFKMELGKDLGPLWYKSELKDGASCINSPLTATKMFFMYLKARIFEYCKDNGLSTDVHYAVSIPASFESNQRHDLLEALRENQIDITGFNFIDEPNAAFLSFINPDEYYKEQISFVDEKNPNVLVFDFGAGTCDISILELSLDYQGIHTRNISISQFEELGGNNIDIYIAHEYLLPRLFKINNASMDDYRSDQLHQIEQQLIGIAEELKIKACRAFDYLLTDKEAYNQVIENGQSVTVREHLNIQANYGDLSQDEFSLSYADFIKAMNEFVRPKKNLKNAIANFFRRDKNYNSITDNIESALKKAKLSKLDIDYVMMVGGSSKNPFIKTYLRDYFQGNTKILIPQDLQTLVSQGAAIHSLLHNAFGIDVIKPITSEKIIVLLENGNEEVLIKAGTEIPFDPVKIDHFSTGDKEVSYVEIPICVSSQNKCLDILKINTPKGKSRFEKNSAIELTISMSADKVLNVSAICEGSKCEISTQNPFANTYLTDQDRAVLKAQKAANISAVSNNGKPTREALMTLRTAYDEADQEFLAAEVLEKELEYYPSQDQYNYLGVLYSNSGNYGKAIQAYKKAIMLNPNNYWAHSNLGHDYYLIGKNKDAEYELRKAISLKVDNPISLIALGEVLEEKNSNEAAEEAKDLYEQAYILLKREWDNDVISDCHLSWFSSVAEKLGHKKVAGEARKQRMKKKNTEKFDYNHLITSTKKTQLNGLFDELLNL